MTEPFSGYFAGKALDFVFRRGRRALEEYWSQGPTSRLLVLLYWQVAERLSLSLEDFQALSTDQRIREPVERFLESGTGLDENTLAPEFERHLSHLDEGKGLARELAALAPGLVPLVRDGSEADAFMKVELERHLRAVQVQIEDARTELLNQGREISEQVVGIRESLDVLVQRSLPPPAPSEDRPDPASAGRTPRAGNIANPTAQRETARVVALRIEKSAAEPEADRDVLSEGEALVESGDRPEAIKLLLEAAEGAESSGALTLAERYREEAAKVLEKDNQSGLAAELLLDIAKAQVARGSQRASLTARKVAELLPPEQRWVEHAVAALSDWPEAIERSLADLRVAVDESEEGSNRAYWLASLVELLVIAGAFTEALEVTAAARSMPLDEGDRLTIELEHLAALEEVEGAEASEGDWVALLEWARAGDRGPAARARVLQRRGMSLIERGESEAAAAVYAEAARAWAAVPGAEDQVGEAFFSRQAVRYLSSEFASNAEELRPLAADLQGSIPTAASIADQLEAQGMRARINGKLYDALRAYWLAFASHRRVGNLRGVLADLEMLGELHENAGRSGQALTFYITGGRESQAARVARSVEAEELAPALVLEGPRWQQAASLAALAEVGRRLPEELVAQVAPRVLAVAAEEPTNLISPQPALRAKEALAALGPAMRDPERSHGVELLRSFVRSGYFPIARPAAEALIRMTNAGTLDEREFLAEAFIHDASVTGISALWIGEKALESEPARERVIAAAREGHRDALVALAAADYPSTDSELRRLCDERTLAAVDTSSRTESEEGGVRSVALSLVSYTDVGIVGRFASEHARRLLVQHLLGVIADDENLESTRETAADALFNIARSLDLDTARTTLDALLPIAEGHYSYPDIDSHQSDPMARINLTSSVPNALRASALHAAAELVRHQPALSVQPLQSVISSALDADDTRLAEAAYQAFARLPTVPLPWPLVVGLRHAEARVRMAALSAWDAREEPLPAGAVLNRLLADPSVGVRLTLLRLAVDRGPAGRPIVAQLGEDPDAYVRSWAKAQLSGLESGGQ